jgi:hypothetical protein
MAGMTEHRYKQGWRPTVVVVQGVFVLSLLWTTLFFAWQSLSAVNFLYPLWYQLLDIHEHISQYGPHNEYKSDFETTSDDVRFALFAQIVDAINSGGEGLGSLSYQDRSGASIRFLREPERIHLQSVANLLDKLRAFSYFALAVLLLSVWFMRRARVLVPRTRRVLMTLVAGSTAVILVVLAMGPERVFNTMHTWVFPAGEQWYFYYEESLMSTLMKAPDLFGAIAVTLLLTALLWCALLLVAVRRLLIRT